MGTVLVADCAYPFDYSRLSKNVPVVLGYVGAPTGTPNVWEVGEVLAVRTAGRAWAPIWTPPDRVFSAQLGRQAGNGMVDALRRYPLVGGEPVFLDIEKHVYDADPHGCRQGVAEWQAIMHAHGHPQAYAYLPAEADSQWVADWVGVAPEHFAPGVIGVQYAGEVDGGRYDLSIFAESVFADLIAHTHGGSSMLDSSDHKWIVDQLTKVQNNLHKIVWAYYDDPDPTHPHQYAARDLSAKLDKLQAEVSKLGTGSVDVVQLADALAGRLGPELAGQLALELSRRLAS